MTSRSSDRLFALLVPALLGGCASLSGGPPAVAISAAEYERHIVTLASDEFEGRKPGTAGERKTVDYLVAEFKKLGLQPGNRGAWTQEVPIVEITAGTDAELKLGDAALAYGKDMVIWTKRVAPEVTLADSPLVERLCGHRHARQDRRDPDQRPRLRHRRRKTVPRSGDDLLRSLDLQVRGGRPPGRHRCDHHP
jgi:hypothetical protein